MRSFLTMLGIIIGVVTSSGMMEVARSGMFNPGLFTFHEVMMLYLGVMFANVILLDLYNSWGLPTSTTVSLIFCLLGAAIAVSIYKISNDPEQGVSSLGHYINTSRAMGIVSAILLSVVIAFTCGTLVMYVSRMIFSFRYTALFRRYGSLWCGASLTAIVYFAVFKGLKSILADHAFIQLIDNHLPSAIAICWVVCSLLLFFIQRFKVNILRITILSGTFALALAFAGNDLVNFIGVPVAGWFITALGGFLIAFVVGLALIYGGTPAFIVITLLCGYMLIHSNFLKKNKESAIVKEHEDTNEDIIANLRDEVCRTMECATKIYDRTLIAVFKENRKVLRDMVKESNDLFYQSRERKYSLLPTLKKLQGGDVNTAHYYVQVVDYLNEMTKALMHITRPAFEHIDNNHEGLSKEQARDLMSINDDVESIYRHINLMLREGDFSEIETVLTMRDQLFESIAEAIKSELTRINEARSNTKASMLYLTILTETKNMVLQSRNLLKSQQYFLKHLTGPKTWIK